MNDTNGRHHSGELPPDFYNNHNVSHEHAGKSYLPPLGEKATAKKAGYEARESFAMCWDCPVEFAEYREDWQAGWMLAERIATRLRRLREQQLAEVPQSAGVSHVANMIKMAVRH